MCDENKIAEAQRQAINNSAMLGRLGQVKTDSPLTAIDEHILSLESVINGLERASLQLDNTLSRARGSQSTPDSPDKVAKPEFAIQRLSSMSNLLNDITQTINAQADEIGHII